MPANDSSRVPESVSRRHFLLGGSAACTIGLAGCASGDSGGTTTTTETTGTTTTGSQGTTETTTEQRAAPLSSTFVLPFSEPSADKAQYNYWNSKQRVERRLVWDRLARSNFSKDLDGLQAEFAEDWEFDGDKLTVSLPDSTWWHSGEQVTSQDLLSGFNIRLASNNTFFAENIEDVKISDEKTFVFNYSAKLNPRIAKVQTLDRAVSSPYDRYKEYIDRIEDAKGDRDELDSITSEIQELTFNTAPGNSIFKIEETLGTDFRATLHEGHWSADEWEGVDDIQMIFMSNDDREWQAFATDQIDICSASSAPPALEQQFPIHTVEATSDSPGGNSVVMHYGREPWNNIKVRKAIAYALNVEDLATNAGANFGSDTISTGLSSTWEEQFCSKIDSFSRYEQDKDKAESLLQEVSSLTKTDGQWMFNEEVLEIKFPVVNRTEYVNIGRTVQGQLEEIGLKPNFQVTQGSQFWSNFYFSDGSSPYDMTIGYWGTVSSLPTDCFWHAFGGIGKRTQYSGHKGHGGNVSVPMPVGEPSGDEQEMNAAELWQTARETTDEQKLADIIQTLSWIVNQDLPIYTVTDGLGGTQYLSNDHWNLPARENPRWQTSNPAMQLWKAGLLTPKRDN